MMFAMRVVGILVFILFGALMIYGIFSMMKANRSLKEKLIDKKDELDELEDAVHLAKEIKVKQDEIVKMMSQPNDV